MVTIASKIAINPFQDIYIIFVEFPLVIIKVRFQSVVFFLRIVIKIFMEFNVLFHILFVNCEFIENVFTFRICGHQVLSVLSSLFNSENDCPKTQQNQNYDNCRFYDVLCSFCLIYLEVLPKDITRLLGLFNYQWLTHYLQVCQVHMCCSSSSNRIFKCYECRGWRNQFLSVFLYKSIDFLVYLLLFNFII